LTLAPVAKAAGVAVGMLIVTQGASLWAYRRSVGG
jgi:hypothetical protein